MLSHKPPGFNELTQAFHADDAARVAGVLALHPGLKSLINEPIGPFDSPAIMNVRSRAMLDVLLGAGADINTKSRWWAGGFALVHVAKPELAIYAIERGAFVDVHAAARLGLFDRLQELVSQDPALVHARGGDGQTPLHFASTIPIVEYLLRHGAEIDALDVDHESTPAQFMMEDRKEIARYLVSRGCQTDLLMAAALGDLELVRKHLAADPDCIRMCVSERWFPKRNPRSGGKIYIWTLGQGKTPHALAHQFGHTEVFRFLMEQSPDALKLSTACDVGDEATIEVLTTSQPQLPATLIAEDPERLPHAARNGATGVVRRLLALGWPVDARGQHQGAALHWAAFHGNLEMAEAILKYHPSLELRDADFKATPMGWATFGSTNGWHCSTGNYAGVVEALLKAGAKPPAKASGSEPVKQVLQRHGVSE